MKRKRMVNLASIWIIVIFTVIAVTLVGIFTLVYSSILNREMLDLAEEIAAQMGSKVFSSKIRRGVDVATAPAHGQSVMTFRANSKPAMDLRKLVDAVAGDQFPRSKR